MYQKGDQAGESKQQLNPLLRTKVTNQNLLKV